MSLQQLQLLIDTNRIDTSKPIDLTSLVNTGIVAVKPDWKHYGIHLTDEVLEFVLSSEIFYYCCKFTNEI